LEEVPIIGLRNFGVPPNYYQPGLNLAKEKALRKEEGGWFLNYLGKVWFPIN